jgi:hypothetical protein
MSAPEETTALVRGRECGECQVCCIITTIDLPEIQKTSGAPCWHSLKGGCDIYETRPHFCRAFYCGWRRSRDFPADWRPDRSGIFAVLEDSTFPQFGPIAVTLYLIGDPLETVRRDDFIDFVIRQVGNRVPVYLQLPRARGYLGARVALNIREIAEAIAKSRADVMRVLEMLLKQLAEHPVTPYRMKHSGNDVGT